MIKGNFWGIKKGRGVGGGCTHNPFKTLRIHGNHIRIDSLVGELRQRLLLHGILPVAMVRQDEGSRSVLIITAGQMDPVRTVTTVGQDFEIPRYPVDGMRRSAARRASSFVDAAGDGEKVGGECQKVEGVGFEVGWGNHAGGLNEFL